MKGKTNTAKILLVLSFLVAALGVITALVVMIQSKKIMSGVWVLVGGLVVAAILRMLANIGQMVFEAKYFLENNISGMNKDMDYLKQNIVTLSDNIGLVKESINEGAVHLNQSVGHVNTSIAKMSDSLSHTTATNLKSMSDEIVAIKDISTQANCDTKDINQGIHKIASFFESIERHLKLKK